jgi:hypothetical protein
MHGGGQQRNPGFNPHPCGSMPTLATARGLCIIDAEVACDSFSCHAHRLPASFPSGLCMGRAAICVGHRTRGATPLNIQRVIALCIDTAVDAHHLQVSRYCVQSATASCSTGSCWCPRGDSLTSRVSVNCELRCVFPRLKEHLGQNTAMFGGRSGAASQRRGQSLHWLDTADFSSCVTVAFCVYHCCAGVHGSDIAVDVGTSAFLATVFFHSTNRWKRQCLLFVDYMDLLRALRLLWYSRIRDHDCSIPGCPRSSHSNQWSNDVGGVHPRVLQRRAQVQ